METPLDVDRLFNLLNGFLFARASSSFALVLLLMLLLSTELLSSLPLISLLLVALLLS